MVMIRPHLDMYKEEAWVMASVSVVILNYNDWETTSNLITSIHDFKAIKHIVVVDNDSSDDSYRLLSSYANERVSVLKTNENRGYSFGNNIGIKFAIKELGADYILIANPDVAFKEDTINELVNALENDNQGAISAPRMIDARGKENLHSVWKLPTVNTYIWGTTIVSRVWPFPFWYNRSYLLDNKVTPVDCVAGSLFMIKASAIERIGFLDENLFLFGEETALAYRLKALGYRALYISSAYFIHRHSVSINKTYKSNYSKYKLLMDSKVYNLREYMNASEKAILRAKMIWWIDYYVREMLKTLRSGGKNGKIKIK